MERLINYSIRKGSFIISNGQQVDEYLDMYRTILHPTYRTEILSRMQARLAKGDPAFYLIAGRETAGAILASLLAHRLTVPALVVRDRVRDHGTCEKVEKPFQYEHTLEAVHRNIFPPYFTNVVLVDDVSSAGIGMLDSIQKLRCEGFNPVLIYSIVYRGLGAHKVAEELGIDFEYEFYYPEQTVS